MFITQYNFKNKFISCPGTKVVCIDKTTGEKQEVYGRRYTYKQEYDKQGKRHLVISDTEDVYNTIQSFKDDVDIYKIVARYFNGDITALDRNKGFYADVSLIPKDINEWQNRIEEGKNIFAGLPTDFKSIFGNSLNEFITSVFDSSFEDKYNNYLESKKSQVQPQVQSQVQPQSNSNGGVSNE